MNKIWRKLLRDLAASKGLFLAVAVVIFLGVAFFGASFLGYRNLKSSYDYSYETLNFADFTVKVVEAPADTVNELESISGVDKIIGRVNIDIPMLLPGEESKYVLARVISLPHDSLPGVNDVKIEQGSYFEEGETNSLLLEKGFAEHHNVNVGDTIYPTIENQEFSFNVAGIVTSPEYIWAAKSRQEILVSPEIFGVVFVPQNIVSELSGKTTVNEFCFLVDEGADSAAIISEAKEILGPYGIMDVVPRDEQPSNAALKLDLQEFAEMAEVFPLLFLIVGALATYILLTRMVHNQRSQIGLMRAMGYSRRQILVHYLSFALITGVIGATTGMLAGYFLSTAVTKLYVGLLGLPYTITKMGWIEWLAIEEGLFLGILPCVIAGIIPAYRASRIPPAEAMRPPAPTTGRRLLLERLFPILTRLSFLWKIPLRNIFRNRRRSIYTIIGVAFGISLILVSAAFLDSIDSLMIWQFDRIQRYDLQINFAQFQSADLIDEVRGWDHVEQVEPVLQVSTSLEHGDETYSTLTTGLSPDSQLYRLYSPAGDAASIDGNGILLSEGLQETLDIDTGDMISVRSPSSVQQFEAVGFVKQPMGSFGYMSLEKARELAGGQPVISSLMVDIEPGYSNEIEAEAYEIPGTASVEVTTDTHQQIDDLMRLIRGLMWVMLGFGAALALAIVFTTITIGIMERLRETATMRTMGERKGRIAAMITIENLLLGLAGLIPGILLGYVLALYFFSLFQTDMLSFDLVIFPRTYLLTIGLIIAIMLVSQLPSIRQINRLDLAKETKIQAS